MAEPIGYVIGESQPTRFMFTVSPEKVPPLLEYVCVYVSEEIDGTRIKVPVLAQIQKIVQRNPILDGLTSNPAASRLLSTNIGIGAHQVIAEARVLGYPYKGNVYLPRYAPMPGAPVYKASSELLRQLYYVDKSSALHIGYLLNRRDVEVYLDLRGFGRHVAILAATGAGKSHTAGVIIEELLKKGATIVAIDPHGDYSSMHEAADGRGFHEFSDRISVLTVGPFRSFGKRYFIKVGDLSDDEIAYIAGIPSNAVNIRRVLSLVIQKLRIMHPKDRAYDLDDLINLLDRWSSGEIEAQFKSKLPKDFDKACFNAIKYLERLKKLRVFSRSSIPLSELLRPMHLTVINLAGVPFEAQDIAVYDILRRIFEARVNQVTGSPGDKYPYPVFIVLEEAHRFVPPKHERNTYSSGIVRTIASEGRKFGVYLIVISQRPSKVDSDVLSQCQSQIVLRIVNPVDQRTISESSEAFSEPLLENLPGLNVGEAIIVGPITKTPVMVKVRKRITKHGGMDLPIVELLRRAREEALKETEDIRVQEYISRLKRELSGGY